MTKQNPFNRHIEELRQSGKVAPKLATSKPAQRRFVQITEAGAKAGAQALECRMFLVWFEILYRVWKTEKRTIELGNKTLADMGVSRWTKYRALAHLEEAGLVRVKRHNQKSPLITLLKRGCVANK